MRVIVLGASGFIGRHLVAALKARGDQVREASLRDLEDAARFTSGCDAVVNLAGAPIAQRWTASAKHEIETSRTLTPARYLELLKGIEDAPRVYVSASAIGYYGTSETKTFTETSLPGDDFLAKVCIEWEAVTQRARELGMRNACIRTALVLGRDGGALAKMLPPFRLGLGGRIGTGRQWYSWVHIDDLVAIYLLALDGAEGALNAAAPNPVTNAEFTKILGDVVHRPTVFPTPVFALHAMLGEGAVVLLEGQRVIPERTESLGYRFTYPTLKEALAASV